VSDRIFAEQLHRPIGKALTKTIYILDFICFVGFISLNKVFSLPKEKGKTGK